MAARRRFDSYVSRQRLSEEPPMHQRDRWVANNNDFDALVKAGVIQLDEMTMRDLVVDHMDDSLDDEPGKTEPLLKIVSDNPAQSQD